MQYDTKLLITLTSVVLFLLIFPMQIKNCIVYRIYTKISKPCQVDEEENSKEDQSMKSTKMMNRKRKVIQGSLDEYEIRESRFGSS